jgi:hypothetical protein
VVLAFAPGELPLGAYTATATLDPANQYFWMSSPPPTSLVVNTDVASLAVNVLPGLAAT